MKLIEEDIDEVTDDLESDESEPVSGKCKHLTPIFFTFRSGETIYKCPDESCTTFDKRRREILSK
jgi:hypothetical protein